VHEAVEAVAVEVPEVDRSHRRRSLCRSGTTADLMYDGHS
jgi:hypothetical protein